MTLTKEDLDNIGKLIDKKFDENFDRKFDGKFAELWEHNIEPALETINGRIDETNKRMATKDDVVQIVRKEGQETRDYIDRKVAEVAGHSVSRDHKLEDKVTLTGKKLVDKKIFTEKDVAEIQEV